MKKLSLKKLTIARLTPLDRGRVEGGVETQSCNPPCVVWHSGGDASCNSGCSVMGCGTGGPTCYYAP